VGLLRAVRPRPPAAGGDSAEAKPAARSTPQPGRLPAGVAADVAETGREVYGRTCIVCHGEDGGGTQLGPSLVDTASIHGTASLDSVLVVVRDGVAQPADGAPPMPAYGQILPEAEVRAVAAYAASLHGSKP
jgi:ubiquinol-cytochrome c reductase cytochrome c subunit